MISNKELQFVSPWASRVPYPGDDYCEQTFDSMINSIKLYNTMLKGCNFNLVFSNGDNIDIEVQERNLAHMIGIDTKNLKSEYFEKFRKDVLEISGDCTSKQLLDSIVDHKDAIIINDRKHMQIINYYKVNIRSNIISKMSDLTNFNFGCINFDKDLYIKNIKANYTPQATKYLYFESGETICPYFLIGLKDSAITTIPEKDEEEVLEETKPYIIETLIAPSNSAGFFKDQEVVIPTEILKCNFQRGQSNFQKIQASSKQKLNLLRIYKLILGTYSLDSNLNIGNDYMNMLIEQSKTR